MKKLKVITEKSVALESPDHIFPVGTKNDNSTKSNYISEVENYWKETILKDRIVEPYPFKNKVRICTNSFYMTMKRNTNV